MQTLVHPKPSQYDLHVIGFILGILNLSYHHACLRIDALVLIVFFLSGIWFFAIGTEPEFETNTAEDLYPSIEGQGKQSYLNL
jgi:hypothetical protein